MDTARLTPLTLEGWYALHQFFRLPWPELKSLSTRQRSGLMSEFADLLTDWADLGAHGWSASYRLFGGGADVMLLHFRSDLDSVGDAEHRVHLTGLGDYLCLEHDYVSVVELGLYAVTAELADHLEDEGVEPGSDRWVREMEEVAERQRENRHVQERLYPRQPEEMPYVSFYPMDKRRQPDDNWYELSLRRRAELMAEHGRIGRRYSGKVSQVITGSVGFDDWEWAVTLFGREPLDFKGLVTEMRYDEVSARFAEFGPFRVGKRMNPGDWEELGAVEG